MEYAPLGNSGLRLSRVGLGSWLTYGRTVDSSVASDCLSAARDRGVNFFDTADVYAQGGAEEVLGRWLKGVPRSDVVVATKVFFPTGPGPNDRGLSRKHIVESCHASLRRLGVDYVDLYQCHRYDPDVPLEETLRALDDLVSQGKVLYAGVSEWPAGGIDAAVRLQRRAGLRALVSNQPQYSLLARGIEAEVLPTCRAFGLGQVVWSPLAGGILTGKYHPDAPPPEHSRASHPDDRRFLAAGLRPRVLRDVQRLEAEVAEPLGLTVAQLSLAWILHREGVCSAIVGATSPDQVEENAAAADATLEDRTIERIEEIMEPFATVMQGG